MAFSLSLKLIIAFGFTYFLSLCFLFVNFRNTYGGNLSQGNSVLLNETSKISSLAILMAAVQDVQRPVLDDQLDLDDQIDSCARFDPLKYAGRTKRRRIFAGGLLADDSWHVIGANALETFGVYHSVTFVESNRTQGHEPRTLRFVPGSEDLRILQSGIFGPDTPVHVENFVHEFKERAMLREHMMRQAILVKWKQLGMTRDDIGLIFDVDEIPAHDFLRATQICELPGETWVTTVNQTCRSPILRYVIPTFEGSPKCVHKGKTEKFARFINPKMVIGACIEGIGDSSRHPLAPRKFTDSLGRPQGDREKGYGEKYDYSKMLNGQDGFFPLYNGADFRRMQGLHAKFGGVGYHLHNFFVSTDKLRFKHAFYGHAHKNAFTVPLGAMNSDLMLLVKCCHNISDTGNRKQRLVDGLEMLDNEFGLPASFRLEGYVDARHREMTALVVSDEEEYGRADNFDGHHLYQEKMLTKPGRRHAQSKLNNTV